MFQSGARDIILTSRRGIAGTLDWDRTSLLKLSFLQSQPGIRLRLEKCDATDDASISSLLSTLTSPLGGCFILTLVLSDALFSNQTKDSFSAVRSSKQGVFDVLSGVTDVLSLDFVIHISSVSGLLGIPGQTPYARCAPRSFLRLEWLRLHVTKRMHRARRISCKSSERVFVCLPRNL